MDIGSSGAPRNDPAVLLCAFSDPGRHMYLYGAARLQNACRKMRGGAPFMTAGSTPVTRPPPGVLWVGSNRPWRARVAIYHPRRAAPLGAWAGPCAAVYMEFHCGRSDLPKRRLPPKTHFGGKALPPPPPPYKIHSNPSRGTSRGLVYESETESALVHFPNPNSAQKCTMYFGRHAARKNAKQ